MKTKLYLDNIKCHGCANSIASKLNELGVSNSKVLVDEGAVEFDHSSESEIELVKSSLKKMGYPEQDQSNLMDSAKSYVSCMIGRVKGPVQN